MARIDMVLDAHCDSGTGLTVEEQVRWAESAKEKILKSLLDCRCFCAVAGGLRIIGFGDKPAIHEAAKTALGRDAAYLSVAKPENVAVVDGFARMPVGGGVGEGGEYASEVHRIGVANRRFANRVYFAGLSDVATQFIRESAQ